VQGDLKVDEAVLRPVDALLGAHLLAVAFGGACRWEQDARFIARGTTVMVGRATQATMQPRPRLRRAGYQRAVAQPSMQR
jgi:hypothetical protein